MLRSATLLCAPMGFQWQALAPTLSFIDLT